MTKRHIDTSVIKIKGSTVCDKNLFKKSCESIVMKSIKYTLRILFKALLKALNFFNSFSLTGTLP